jgi:hypothetical protein
MFQTIIRSIDQLDINFPAEKADTSVPESTSASQNLTTAYSLGRPKTMAANITRLSLGNISSLPTLAGSNQYMTSKITASGPGPYYSSEPTLTPLSQAAANSSGHIPPTLNVTSTEILAKSLEIETIEEEPTAISHLKPILPDILFASPEIIDEEKSDGQLDWFSDLLEITVKPKEGQFSNMGIPEKLSTSARATRSHIIPLKNVSGEETFNNPFDSQLPSLPRRPKRLSMRLPKLSIDSFEGSYSQSRRSSVKLSEKGTFSLDQTRKQSLQTTTFSHSSSSTAPPPSRRISQLHDASSQHPYHPQNQTQQNKLQGKRPMSLISLSGSPWTSLEALKMSQEEEDPVMALKRVVVRLGEKWHVMRWMVELFSDSNRTPDNEKMWGNSAIHNGIIEPGNGNTLLSAKGMDTNDEAVTLNKWKAVMVRWINQLTDSVGVPIALWIDDCQVE